jgi:hypothetical protein
VFENRMQTGIFKSVRAGETGGWKNCILNIFIVCRTAA